MIAFRRLLLTLALTTALPAAIAAEAAPPAVAATGEALASIDALYADVSIIGTSPEGFAWSPDASRLLFLWNEGGAGRRDVWAYDPARRSKTRLTRFGDEGRTVSEAAWLSGGRIALVEGGRLLFRAPDGTMSAVEGVSGASRVAVSPDGRHLAFVSQRGLWVLPVMGGQPIRLVEGQAKLGIDSYSWNRDGKTLAFTLADERAMREIAISYDAGGKAHRELFARAFPGDPTNITYKIGTVAVGGGAPRLLERTDEGDPIWSYQLSPDGRRLLVNASDQSIKHHFIDVYDLADGRRSRFYSYDDPAQIRPDWQAVWDGDGKGMFLLTNRDGFNQIYHLPRAGVAPRQITRAPGEIDMFLLDAKHGRLYYRGNAPTYAERRWFRTGTGGGPTEEVTPGEGTHDVVFAPDFSKVADRASNDHTPPELHVRALNGRVQAEQVTRSPLPAFYRQRWADVRYVDYRSHVDGALLTARVMLPPDFDPTKRYPMIVGSVYSDAVRNQWGGRTAHPTWGLDQFLVARGYIVINPGIRGSFGRGRDWNKPMLHSYGTLDIDDIQDGASKLVDMGYADPKRIGIWGSSYGGLMTLMSLFKKPGFYAAGIAGAPASNVAHAYPEQQWIMGPPNGPDYPARYERQSALYQSQGLADPLMIIHGARDEVVLYADTMALTERMIGQGKLFELVTLPGAGHPWDMEGLPQTRFAFRKMVEFFDRHLRPADPAAAR